MFPACGATITAIMTTKTKPYKLLREKISPKARAAAEKKTQELLAALTAGDGRTDQVKREDRRRQVKTTK
ncbi:MAG: hypothetical protein ACYC7L_09685 [Nitrospirota bacterium]